MYQAEKGCIWRERERERDNAKTKFCIFQKIVIQKRKAEINKEGNQRWEKQKSY